MRDYANTEGDAQERNIAFLKPYVWSWMYFDHIHSGNFRHSWVIDPSNGIESIAHFVAHTVNDDETYAECTALRRRHNRSANPRSRWWSEQGMGFMSCVYGAIIELIEEGKVEIALEFGWPVLRLTMGNLGVFEPSHSEDFDQRAETMRRRVDELRSMPYADYLQSPEWRYRREIHLEAAGRRCQLCNSPDQPLHVHHRTYANRGREHFYDLVVLCQPCHEAFHKSGRRVQ